MVNKFNLLHTVLYNSCIQDVKMLDCRKIENFSEINKRLASEQKKCIMKSGKLPGLSEQDDSEDNLKSHFSKDKISVLRSSARLPEHRVRFSPFLYFYNKFNRVRAAFLRTNDGVF